VARAHAAAHRGDPSLERDRARGFDERAMAAAGRSEHEQTPIQICPAVVPASGRSHL
jgi:hypothetical protein